MRFSFLVVDDERLSRDYIKSMIYEFEPRSVVQEASSSKNAKTILEQGETDILFLDIKMQGMNGFELLHSLSKKDFELIFITAYNQYAIKAIREDAFDYLLKPIKKNEFKDTLQRVIKKRNAVIDHKMQVPNEKENYLDQSITLHSQRSLKLVKLKDILYLKADNSYTEIYFTGGNKIITSKPINRYESILDPKYFFRIHKSCIINTHHFKEYLSKDGDVALMDNGDELFISRYRLGQFLELIKNITGDLKI